MGETSATVKEHVLTCQNLHWADITKITMNYSNEYENSYSVDWWR